MPPVDSGAHFVSRPKANTATVHTMRIVTAKLLIKRKIDFLNFCERLAELGGTGLDRVRWLCRSGWLTGFGHFCDFGGHLGVKRQLWAEKQARLFAICA
jgi:hypothetical protein